MDSAARVGKQYRHGWRETKPFSYFSKSRFQSSPLPHSQVGKVRFSFAYNGAKGCSEVPPRSGRGFLWATYCDPWLRAKNRQILRSLQVIARNDKPLLR